ncbi:MAG: peptide deformylase [Bacteroidota bacterium]
MVLPIYAYGQPVLKKVAEEIDPDYPDLQQLMEDMWETMYNAQGVGLAAPQIGKSIRIFMIDTEQLDDGEGTGKNGMKQVFINAQKIEEGGKAWGYEEGCLSIPDIRGDVKRPAQIRLRYQDENFEEHERIFTGMIARVIQHEYDHIDGVLFTDLLKPLKKRRIKRRLENVKKGNIQPEYRMRFAK